MNLRGPFILNDRSFTLESLLVFLKAELAKSSLESWKSELYTFIQDFLDEGKVLIQKTSGTTGDPKSIELNRDSMIRSAEMTNEFFNLQSHDRVLLCLPVQYIAGKMMVIRALVGGMNLITTEPSGDPMKSIDSPIDFAAMVPLQVFGYHDKTEKLEIIKKLIIGGGEINPDLRRTLRKVNKPAVYETFAMSETYTHFAIRRINGPTPEAGFKVLKGVQIGVDDRECLTVDMPGITKGIVRSNDLIKLMGPGEFEWLGRIDNVINSGGIKIIPELLEKRISEALGIEAIIIGFPDQKLGQKLIMLVEGDIDEAKFEFWNSDLVTHLKKHELPKEIKAVAEFPRNQSMKVQRGELIKMIL